MPMSERTTVARVGLAVTVLAVSSLAVAEMRGGNPWSLSPPPSAPVFSVDGGHTGAFPPQGYRPSSGPGGDGPASGWPAPVPMPHTSTHGMPWGAQYGTPFGHTPHGSGWPYSAPPHLGIPPYSGVQPWVPSHSYFPFTGFPLLY